MSKQIKLYYPYIKHSLDFIFALILLIILIPLFLIVSIAIILDSGLPIIYKQKRVGQYNKIFNIYKFRTMVKDADKKGPELTVKNDSRITRVGKFLRRTSIDELPQIINILKGEMSFIGPRPEIPSIVQKYMDIYTKVLQVRPGISGWAQVNGRDELTIEQKLKFDTEYVNNVSFLFDLKVFFLTFPAILSSKGVN